MAVVAPETETEEGLDEEDKFHEERMDRRRRRSLLRSNRDSRSLKKRFLGLFRRNYEKHTRNRKSGKKAKTNRRNNNPILRNH